MSSSISGALRSSSTRTVRKVEAPRPLKTSLSETKMKSPLSSISLSAYSIESIDKVVTLLDMVASAIVQHGDDSRSITTEASALLTSNIIHLCKHLKLYGQQLDTMYQGQLDRAFSIFREAMVNGTLEYVARVNLLEILELREHAWIPETQSLGKNYLSSPSFVSSGPEPDLSDMKHLLTHYPLTGSESTANLVTDEVIRRSGKHRDKSSKIPSKSYCKGEILIRNSDSGKVMGIKGRRVHMIEQLSETIISFQRVAPTAKERLVQITGPNEENISYAERLIEETIRNNSSPVRGLFESDSSCSSGESSVDLLGSEDYDIAFENGAVSQPTSHANENIQPYQYKHKVIVSNCQLTITGDDYTYVTVAKAVLDDYFNKLRKSELTNEDVNGDDVFVNKISKSYPDPVKISSSALERDADSSFPTSKPLETSSAVSSTISSTYEPSDFTGASVTSSVPIIVPSADDITGSTAAFDDIGNIDTPPLRSDSADHANVEESKTIYSKELILKCRESELSRKKPKNWDVILSRFPAIAKDQANVEQIIEIAD